MNTSHVKKLWLCTLLLFAGRFLMAQTTIVQWDFNDGTRNPSVGQATGATLNPIGGVNTDYFSGVGADPVVPASSNKALSTDNYPAQSTGAKTAGIKINANTTGYNSIHLKFYIRHSDAAAKKVVVQYLDGNTWQDAFTYTAPTNNNFSSEQNVDLSGYTSANNSNNFQVRLVTDYSNGNSYVAANSPSTNYGTGGTIRYDFVTITGNSLGCGNPATQQATGLRLLKTNNSSANLSLNRGNGTGCLVLCSTGNIPTTAPVTGANYAANSTYGSGSAVGNAFTVYNTQVNNPPTHYFNINGLTAGTKYYVAAYEYSSTGYCYLSPGVIDSFYCNSTILYPGDVQFVGYDIGVLSGGKDAFALSNLKAINKGTSFQIVNSRYEAGAAANVRTNRWYAGSADIFSKLETIAIIYDSSVSLTAGSILSFNFSNPRADTVRVNGNISNAFTIVGKNITGTSSMLSNSAFEQFFLTQGRFTSTGTEGTDLYSVLDGHVLHGISSGKRWVDFNSPCSAANNSTSRESRIPADISCLNLFFDTIGYAYYKPASNRIGSQGLLLGNINTENNWRNDVGSTNSNDISSIYNSQFNISPTIPLTANWTGSTDGNWFNCTNWENLYVPDSTADVTVATAPTAAIDANGALAAEYGSVATTRNLNITGAVNLSGTSADKLIVYDVLQTSGTGSLTTSGTVTDTVVVRGGMQSGNSNGLQLSSNGWLALHNNRQLQPINVSLASTTVPVAVSVLSLNNPPGANIINGGFESLIKLELANGILSPVTANAFHYMGAACTINSPINLYNETNKGWEKSYIDGKVFVRTNANTSYTAPLGSKQKGVFAPMLLYPAGTTSTVYEAGYVGMSHPNTGPSNVNNPPITKVSTQEYWTLVSNPINMAASLTLYYTPLSFVGGPQGTDPQALTDLRIVQYWDSSAGSPRKWRYPTFPIFFNAGPTVQYGKISMGQYATSLNDADRNFTLGSGQGINTLPVKIIHWIARLQGNRTQLTWQVQQEAGTAYYIVEKSLDSKTFHPVQTVYASGLPAYACFDNTPADGWNYYRLKVTDLSGKVSYTSIEKALLKHTATFAVFPNPASDKVFITLPFIAKGSINLYTPDGRKCITQSVANSSFTHLTIKDLPTGWYLLEYTDGKNQITQKLMIK